MSGIVIAGFAGIGKTTLAKKYKNVIDLESSLYKYDNSLIENIPVEKRKGLRDRKINKDWPLNYINKIKESIELYDIVLVWIHKDVLKLYEENKIEYILCYPNSNAIDIYKQRYINRGNRKEYIDKVVNTYDVVKKEFDEKDAEKIILDGEETLEDYLLKNGFKLIK